MAIFWMTVDLVNREVRGRDLAERSSAVLNALRENCEGYNYTSFDDTEVPRFYIFKAANLAPLRVALREALGEGDTVLIKAMDVEQAGIHRAGNPLANVRAYNREGSFDRFWR